TRIIFGYIAAMGLVGFAVKLKPKYHNFSAVLMSGGLAAMYFVTYFGYSAYGLIAQPAAFVLMAMFTVFTVAAALFYSRQVIAHIGLVGAYAVPFLLSQNSANYAGLFTYMAIVNAGILAISIKKLWRPIFYTASFFTWVIFGAWLGTKYAPEHLGLALGALGVFFAIFYATKVVHGVLHSQHDSEENIGAIVITAVGFFIAALAIGNVQLSTMGYATFLSFVGAFALAMLLTSYEFYGRVLIFVTYPFTWVAYLIWFVRWYNPDQHFALAWAAAGTYFLVFYLATLFYRLVTDELGLAETTSMMLTNSFVFYGAGYAILDSREEMQSWEGLYTAANAVFHSIIAQIVSRVRASAVDVVQLLTVLIVTFTTITIPVQFDGQAVTVMWAVEAAALFWMARSRGVKFFEYLSYPVMVLAGFSLAYDWSLIGASAERTPFLNGDVVTEIVFVAVAAFVYQVHKRARFASAIGDEPARYASQAIAAAGTFVLYNMIRIEIATYFDLLRQLSPAFSPDIDRFGILAQMNYTLLFLAIFGIVDLKRLRSQAVSGTVILFGILTILITSTAGMWAVADLRQSYPNF
ncbi:MAG TPA: DUF2339 domain-containing protein, partial [Pyrinomonadaceae bacterium]